jgi:hypothetical protein
MDFLLRAGLPQLDSAMALEQADRGRQTSTHHQGCENAVNAV